MTETEMEKRLQQLRQGFDIAIEHTLRHKAALGHPIVVASPDGTPSLHDAAQALAEFEKSKARKKRPVLS